MEKQYSIIGMSCMGCKDSVEKALSQVAGVKHVEVDLPQALATITSDHEIPFELLKESLKIHTTILHLCRKSLELTRCMACSARGAKDMCKRR